MKGTYTRRTERQWQRVHAAATCGHPFGIPVILPGASTLTRSELRELRSVAARCSNVEVHRTNGVVWSACSSAKLAVVAFRGEARDAVVDLGRLAEHLTMAQFHHLCEEARKVAQRIGAGPAADVLGLDELDDIWKQARGAA